MMNNKNKNPRGKMNKILFVIIFFCGLNFITACGNKAKPAVSFYPAYDVSKTTAGVAEYKAEEFIISRVNIDGPYYDGMLGYNVFTVRKMDHLGFAKDVFTLLAEGQYEILGYEPVNNAIIACEKVQDGAVLLFKQVVIFKNNSSQKISIGPKGLYQYISCSPDGRFFLLVDEGIKVYDMKNNKTGKVTLDYKISPEASDPGRQIKRGYNTGGSAVNQGEFLYMKWSSEKAGRVTIKNIKGTIIKEIDVDCGAVQYK
jgi:hypothetical protein